MARLLFDALFALAGVGSTGRRRFDADELSRWPLWAITTVTVVLWLLVGIPTTYMIAIAPGPMLGWLLLGLGPGLAATTAAAAFAVATSLGIVERTDGQRLAARLLVGGLMATVLGVTLLVVRAVVAFLDLMSNMG